LPRRRWRAADRHGQSLRSPSGKCGPRRSPAPLLDQLSDFWINGPFWSKAVLVSSTFPAEKPPFDVEAASKGKLSGQVVSATTLLKAVRYYMTVGKDPGLAMLASEMSWKVIGELQKMALN
jgi:hypothetical protein